MIKTKKNLISFGINEIFDKLFISIAAPIAAGKTTLAKALSKLTKWDLYLEDIKENPYLKKFYDHQNKPGINPYAFSLQMYLLEVRYEQQQKIIWSKKGGIQDRTIYEDLIFAKMLADSGKMSQEDYKTYKRAFKNKWNFMNNPHLIVYLKVTAEESFKRLKHRNRGIEVGVPFEYLKNLCRYYDSFIDEISKTVNVIEVDYSNFKSEEDMAKYIKASWREMKNIKKIK